MTAIQKTMLPVGQLEARCKRAMRVLLIAFIAACKETFVECLAW